MPYSSQTLLICLKKRWKDILRVLHKQLMLSIVRAFLKQLLELQINSVQSKKEQLNWCQNPKRRKLKHRHMSLRQKLRWLQKPKLLTQLQQR
jgi:hypothetical protein